MKNATSIRSAIYFGTLILMGGGAGLVGSSALAQQTEEITVVAPRVVHREISHFAPGTPNERVTVSRWVAFHDLDLKKAADIETLKGRVNDAARADCDDLNRLFPDSMTPARNVGRRMDCIETAVNDAMLQVDAAIAAAHK